MKPVIQQHPEGCALACAAMLAGLSYIHVAAVAGEIDIRAGDKALYHSTVPLRRLLARLGIQVGQEEVPFDSWPCLPDRALLATKWHPEADGAWWHWVVFSRENGVPVVFDPDTGLADNRRYDFSAIEPKWFIEVEKTSGEAGGFNDTRLPERLP